MATTSLVERIDAAIAEYFAAWNIWTTLLCGVLVIALLWPILTSKDPDIHPFLLARQAQASPVRQPGESAVYRANEIPYGYPLRKGLAVKDPGAAKWSAGRDGDLRDVWKQALRGSLDDAGNPTGSVGKLMTPLGIQKVIDHELSEVTTQINIIGKYIQENGGKTVAVCLSNSVETMVTVFASAFYGFKPVLVPDGLQQTMLNRLLAQTSADFLIAEAGSIELDSVLAAAPSIKHIIWVAKDGSRHLDWNVVPEGAGSELEVSTWHETVDDRKAISSATVPEYEKDSKHGPIGAFAPGNSGQYELVEYSAANIVAGVGGLLSTMSRTQRLTHADILLPTTPLSESYTLCWVLAALFSGASVALNSVAGDAVDLKLAVAGVRPTIIVTSAGTINKYSDQISALGDGLGAAISSYLSAQSLRSGILSTKKFVPATSHLFKLRAVLIAQRDTDNQKVPSSLIAKLRLALGARVGYALTSGSVAGAVTQTNVFDYRDKLTAVNVGAPVTSVEVLLTGADKDMEGVKPRGKVTVRGPAVIGGQASLDVIAEIESDHTFNLL